MGADNLGLLFDTFTQIEEPSIADSLLAAGGRSFHVDVADSNRWYPGAGDLDFAQILDVLARSGYGGFVSAEFMPRPDADTAAAAAIVDSARASAVSPNAAPNEFGVWHDQVC